MFLKIATRVVVAYFILQLFTSQVQGCHTFPERHPDSPESRFMDREANYDVVTMHHPRPESLLDKAFACEEVPFIGAWKCHTTHKGEGKGKSVMMMFYIPEVPILDPDSQVSYIRHHFIKNITMAYQEFFDMLSP